MIPDLESVYAVIADAKGRNADNFVVRKFRKKNLRNRDICDTSAKDAKDRILSGYLVIKRCNGPIQVFGAGLILEQGTNCPFPA